MAKADKKLLIALDVFSSENRNVKNALETVKGIANQGQFRSQAIAVLGPQDLAWPTSFSPQWAAHFSAVGKEQLTRALKKLNFKTDDPARLLLKKEYSKRVSAKSLAEEAKNNAASMLVLFTHIKKSTSFAPLGGFAETVANSSEVPVLAVNASARPVKRIKTALFATDLSPETRDSFRKACELAKAMKFKIVLFHNLFQPTYALAYAGSTFVPSAPQLTSVFEAEEMNAQRTAQAWKKDAEKMGVTVEIRIVTGINDPATEIIKWSHGAGKKLADMIIIAPQVSQLASLVLGSTTRSVLRNSKKPVLLIQSFEKTKGVRYAEQNISPSYDNETRSNTL